VFEFDKFKIFSANPLKRAKLTPIFFNNFYCEDLCNRGLLIASPPLWLEKATADSKTVFVNVFLNSTVSVSP